MIRSSSLIYPTAAFRAECTFCSGRRGAALSRASSAYPVITYRNKGAASCDYFAEMVPSEGKTDNVGVFLNPSDIGETYGTCVTFGREQQPIKANKPAMVITKGRRYMREIFAVLRVSLRDMRAIVLTPQFRNARSEGSRRCVSTVREIVNGSFARSDARESAVRTSGEQRKLQRMQQTDASRIDRRKRRGGGIEEREGGRRLQRNIIAVVPATWDQVRRLWASGFGRKCILITCRAESSRCYVH